MGLGSTQAVGAVKRNLREAGLLGKGKDKLKVGHGGTLDPLASGVLPIALGEATKLCGRMLDASKIYEFTIQFGVETETLDSEGDVSETSDVRPTLEQIKDALAEFIGDIEQIPPKYSALKINGQRAYDLARAGVDVEMKRRNVTIFDLNIVQLFYSQSASHHDNISFNDQGVSLDHPDATIHHLKTNTRHSVVTARNPEAADNNLEATTRHPEATHRHPEATTRHPEATHRHPEATHRHPEFISGSHDNKILNQVQHDEVRVNDGLGEMQKRLEQNDDSVILNQVQHDDVKEHELHKPTVRPEPVEGSDAEQISQITLCAHVSKGTYIRSLARDIAYVLGSVGHVVMLRRIKAGPFSLKHTISLDKLDEIGKGAPLKDIILPMEAALDDTPALYLSSEQAKAIQQGRVLSGVAGDGLHLAWENEIPIALVEISHGDVRIIRGFNIG